MAQKKCSKCGELNPPEAVMCWACYTPLSGAGAATMTARGMAPQASSEVSSGKKAVEPWQLGVIGVGVLIAVAMGARTLMSAGGGETVSTAPPPSTPDSTSYAQPAPAAAPSMIAGSSGGGAAGVSTSIKPAAIPLAGQMNFTISVPPKRNMPWATMAIVPAQGNTTPQVAATLAASARRQLAGTGNWTGLYIYVFSDQQAALKLKAFQAERDGKPLGQGDYQTLKEIWPSALARYEYSKGWEAIRYPSANPGGWWQGQSKYNKAQM